MVLTRLTAPGVGPSGFVLDATADRAAVVAAAATRVRPLCPQLADFILGCAAKDMGRRLSAEEVVLEVDAVCMCEGLTLNCSSHRLFVVCDAVRC